MSFDDIRRSLSSNKVNCRKKGRLDCEQTILQVNQTAFFNQLKSMSFLHAVMEYENKEIDYALSKSKNPNVDIALFFKKSIKFLILNGQIVSSKGFRFIEHCVNILNNNNIINAYKLEHKYLLCDVLHPKFCHSIPFDGEGRTMGLKTLFIYLKPVMVIKKDIIDPNNVKILLSTCKSLFNDENSNVEVVVTRLLVWFQELILRCEDDDNASMIIIAAILECSIFFIKYKNINVAFCFFEYGDFLLDAILKLLANNILLRENRREIAYKFLNSYLSMSMDCNVLSMNYNLYYIDPIRIRVNNFAVILCTDENLKVLMTNYSSNLLMKSTRSNHDSAFNSPIDDAKFRTYYEVLAKLFYFNRSVNNVDYEINSNSQISYGKIFVNDFDTSQENLLQRINNIEIGISLVSSTKKLNNMNNYNNNSKSSINIVLNKK
jgi:hypothetical protein